MTHLAQIQAVPHAAMLVSRDPPPGTFNIANAKVNFATVGDFELIKNIRDMPSMGNTANIVKVPQYGLKTSLEAAAQGDFTELEVVVNYDPSLWLTNGSSFDTSGTLMDSVGDNVSKVFCLALLASTPASFATTTTVPCIGGTLASPILNTLFWFIGRIESITYMPARDDVVTASIKISLQSDLIGPGTVTATV